MSVGCLTSYGEDVAQLAHDNAARLVMDDPRRALAVAA